MSASRWFARLDESHVESIERLTPEMDEPSRRGLPLPPVEEPVAAWVARMQQRWEQRRELVIVVCDADGICGLVSLSEIHHGSAVLAYWVRPSKRGRGHALAGAQTAIRIGRRALGLTQLESWVAPDNLASRAILSRLGFEAELHDTEPSVPLRHTLELR